MEIMLFLFAGSCLAAVIADLGSEQDEEPDSNNEDEVLAPPVSSSCQDTPCDNFDDGDKSENFLIGGPGHDLLMADDSGVEAWGLGGNDTIYGGEGNDYLLGDGGDSPEGDDVIYAGSGDDIVVGGAGNDILYGENGSDTLHGGPGNDTILGGNGHDLIYSGSGSNEIYGGEGNDTIFGSDHGSSRIDPGPGENKVHLAGNDHVVGGEGANLYIIYPDSGSHVFIDGFTVEKDAIELDVTGLNINPDDLSLHHDKGITHIIINNISVAEIRGGQEINISQIRIFKSS